MAMYACASRMHTIEAKSAFSSGDERVSGRRARPPSDPVVAVADDPLSIENVGAQWMPLMPCFCCTFVVADCVDNAAMPPGEAATAIKRSQHKTRSVP